MADWNNLTKEDAAAAVVAYSLNSSDYVGANDEHEFGAESASLNPDGPGAFVIVTDVDTGLAYKVSVTAQRAPEHDA